MEHTYHICIHFHKVNLVTKTDSFPIPRVEDCIDRIGHAQHMSKLDPLKDTGRYVSLTPRAKYIPYLSI